MSEAEVEKSDDVTVAIQVAKAFLLHAFQGEAIENLGLEEVKQDGGSQWSVTLGFNRKWDYPAASNTFLQMAASAVRPRRTFKTVVVDLDGPKGVSITNYRDE